MDKPRIRPAAIPALKAFVENGCQIEGLHIDAVRSLIRENVIDTHMFKPGHFLTPKGEALRDVFTAGQIHNSLERRSVDRAA